MLDWLTDLTRDGIALARLVIVLIAIVSIASVWFRTKALVPVLGAVLLAGVAIWATSGPGIAQVEEWIRDETIDEGAPASLDRQMVGSDLLELSAPASPIEVVAPDTTPVAG